MIPEHSTEHLLREENAELRARLEDSEETLRAIRAGEVDALIVESNAGAQVFILQSSDTESNRFRSDILGKVSDAVVAMDQAQHVIYMNAAAERQYGVTASHVLGHHFSELYELQWHTPEDEVEFNSALAEIGHWRGTSTHVRRDGSAIQVESSVSCLLNQDGGPSGILSVIRDVTEQSAAADTLRENQIRLQLTLEAAQIGDWELDLATDTSQRSLLHDQIFGYPEGVKEWGYRHFLNHVHPDDRAFVVAHFKEVIETNSDLRFECRIIWPDGSHHWINAYGSISHTAKQGRKKFLGVIFDITERKLAEESLRHNEALFSTIIDQAPGGVYVVDDQLRMLQVNALALPSFASAEPVIGKDFSEVMHLLWGEQIGNEIVRIFQHTLRTGDRYISPRFTHQRHDLGLEKSYDWETQRLILPNGRHGVVCYFSDVTMQWQLEEALRTSEQHANNIIQSITDGFITMDSKWRITYLSNRGAEILAPLQITATNVLGKVFWNEFPHSIGTSIETNYRKAMDEQIPVQFEAFYPPLDKWFDLRVYPSLTGISLFFLDITERKEAETALHASRQVLAEQAAALRLADRSKDEFLAMLAHELRNPLAPLRNATAILQAPNSGPRERDYAQGLIARQIENMSRMIDDLLDVSRITEGKIELRVQTVELATILQNAANAAQPACDALSQQLTVSLPAESIILNADATRLEQILGNLLGNASKYSGKGSHIELAAEKGEGDQVLIRVKDDGIGIDPELLPRIFDLFVQSSRTLDRSHGGLGIGLTIVHRLVRMHEGCIEARSDGLGKGSEFLIRLPAHFAKASAISSVPPAGHERPFRILVVDDNKDAAETMAMLQSLRGHETRLAHTGPEALEVAEEFLPEVVLLDIGLPGMDGYDVARHLRSMEKHKDAFLVALTGYGTLADRALAVDAGFNEHLVKPADLSLLSKWLSSRP
jgi:PAS domain S-box-containing protein